jgi:hypothetical protein
MRPRVRYLGWLTGVPRRIALLGICALVAGPLAATVSPAPALGAQGCYAASAISGACAALQEGAPNDPYFAQCETQPTVTGCTDTEEWDFYGPLSGNDCPGPATAQPAIFPHPDGGLPCWATNATDPQHAAGLNEPGAWAQGNIGRPEVLIAYMEGGVNYDSDSVKDALDNIFLNRGELPYPENAQGLTKPQLEARGVKFTNSDPYDLLDDGHFDIREYAQDPRVNPPCPPGVAPFVHYDDEGVTFGCVAGGQHQYVAHVHVGGKLTPYLSPEDLIAVFGHCQIVGGYIGPAGCPPGGRFDNDHNGYPNDISGWNFEYNTNDPNTTDAAYDHAPGNLSALVGVADNGYGSLGWCPNCTVVPIHVGPECVDLPNRWAEGVLYATDLGADVISSVVVQDAYSKEDQEAVDYAYKHGVLLSLDSNDFDSMDHTDGMLFAHAFPGNSLAEDYGSTAANATTTFRARSNITSYGTHNLFSVEGYYTSGATPSMAGVLAMVQSAALNAISKWVISSKLTPDEVKSVLMDTASPVIPQTQSPRSTRQWPGNPLSQTDSTHTNWSTDYGYGRPDLGAATAMVMAGRIPPTAVIDSPSWFKYVDPKVQPMVPVYGRIAPSRFNSSGHATWWLEWALGANPADAAFHTVASGTITRPRSGLLGTIDLRRVPAVYYEHPPLGTLQPAGPEQYTLTIRLRIVDGNGLKGEDRRSVGLRHDPSLVGGMPLKIGAEGAASPTYADLEGRHQLDLVFGSYDGTVRALRPDGSEVPGFPVRTHTLASISPLEPENFPAPAYRLAEFRDVRDPVTGIAVGDLLGNGQLDVVADTDNAFLYAWDSRGRLLPGFPVHSHPAYWTLPVPTPRAATPHSRLPSQGAWSPPVLADLEGNGKLDILMSAFDGYLYAWQPDGHPVPGWPVKVALPAADFARDGVDPSSYISDPKLMYAPAVADVLGKGKPQVFVSSFDCNGVGTSTENLGLALLGQPPADNQVAKTWIYGIWPEGNNHPGGPYLPGWPVALNADSFCYDQSIDFVGEGTSAPVIGDIGGQLRIVTAPITGPAYVVNGDGSIYKTLSSACTSAACGPLPPYRPTGDTHMITLTGGGALTDLAGDGSLQFAQSEAGVETTISALDIPGQAAVPQVYQGVWDLQTGVQLPPFPKRVAGFTFYDEPLCADLAGLGTRSVAVGTDTYWLYAFTPAGVSAPGFPKYTGQWPGFGGVIGDPELNGQLQLAWITREGWLYRWNVSGSPALANCWPHFRHDNYNSGDYELDTARPAAVDDLGIRVSHGRTLLTWRAPGGDYQLGRAARYEIRYSTSPITAASFARAQPLAAPAPAAAGTAQAVALPRAVARLLTGGDRVFVAIRSVNRAGNVSALSNVVELAGSAL